MTRAKAVETLKAIRVYARIDEYEALDMAIESIENDYARGVLKGLELSMIKTKGEWLDNETTFSETGRQTATCSVCGLRSPRPLGEFCRWCGCKMKGVSE